LFYTNNFTSCFELGQSLLERDEQKNVTVRQTRDCLEEPGTLSYKHDPCCTPTAAWDSVCCLPQTKEVRITELKFNETAIDSCPGNTQCVKSYSSDFILEELKVNGVGKLSLCARPATQGLSFYNKLFEPYVTCRDLHFGINHTLGINCERDSDCIDGKCNLITGYCLNDIQRQETRFLRCMIERLDPFIIDTLRRKYSIHETKIPTSDLFLSIMKRAWTTKDCVSGTELGLPFRSSYSFAPHPFNYNCVNSTIIPFNDIDPRPIFPVDFAPENLVCSGIWVSH